MTNDTNAKKVLSYTYKKSGFTLVETLVAITVLVVAIVGPLGLATNSLFAAFASRDQMVASMLAQDAMEYVRYKKDSYTLNGESLLGDTSDPPSPPVLSICTSPSAGCWVDSFNDTFDICNTSQNPPPPPIEEQCEPVLYDDSTGIYNYATGDETQFTRIVYIREIDPGTPGNEYEVEVLVRWNTRNITRSFSAREIIYDWVPN